MFAVQRIRIRQQRIQLEEALLFREVRIIKKFILREDEIQMLKNLDTQ